MLFRWEQKRFFSVQVLNPHFPLEWPVFPTAKGDVPVSPVLRDTGPIPSSSPSPTLTVAQLWSVRPRQKGSSAMTPLDPPTTPFHLLLLEPLTALQPPRSTCSYRTTHPPQLLVAAPLAGKRCGVSSSHS
ncbi:hypothetical protein AGIG_G25300 [Arapaima gigas]